MPRQLLPQGGREIPIDLDRQQRTRALRQPYGQDTGPRPDLEEPIRRLRRDGGDDFVGPRRREEMLPEAAAGGHAFSIDSPRQNFSSISSISSSLNPK